MYFGLGQGDDYVYHGITAFVGVHSNHELELSEKQKEFFERTSVSDLYPEYYVIKTNRFNESAKDTLDERIYFLKITGLTVEDVKNIAERLNLNK